MFDKLRAKFQGEALGKRAMRGTLLTAGLAFGEQGLRFLSNLILARLLFPEAFGLMAIIQVFITGLEMISNIGFRASVVQNPRGETPEFLNTVWTLQIIRGVLLWGVVIIFAPWIAQIYGQPELAQMLPVAGFGLVIHGLITTRVLLVQRQLKLGTYSRMKLLAQAIGLAITVLMAYIFASVWVLVFTRLLNPLLALILFARYLPGPRNRLMLERQTVRDVVSLGKFLFISTMATYVLTQSDRAVLGLFIPIDLLGIYGIAFALATLPAILARQIANSVVFPLYRMHHPLDSAKNQQNIFRSRRLISLGGLGICCVMAFLGPWLMNTLYDPRYALAGPIAVLLCTANVPMIVLNGVMNAALAKGDSFSLMLTTVITAIVQGTLIYFGARYYGVTGAALAIGLAQIVTYPVLVPYLRRYGNWDPLGDIGLMVGGLAICGLACWLHADQIALLWAL